MTDIVSIIYYLLSIHLEVLIHKPYLYQLNNYGNDALDCV